MIKPPLKKRRFFTIYKTTKFIKITTYEKCSDIFLKNVLTNTTLRAILQLQTKKYNFGGFSAYGN
jgi:hypothetical protein